MARLSDLVEDVPLAPVLTGRMLGGWVAAGRLQLRDIADAMLNDDPVGEGEGGADPPLVDAEKALPLVVELLNAWRSAAGDDGAAARAAWAATGLDWRQLLPEFAREDADVAKSLEKAGGAWLA